MPDYTVVKLQHFKSGLHLARGLTNAYDRTHDTLHSDKLKSAIFVSALQLFGKDEINESFFHAFTISSAFPFYYSPSANKTFYFFPKPETPIPVVAEAEGLGKKLKRIRYIEKGLFERLLTGDSGVHISDANLQGVFMAEEQSDFSSVLAREKCEAVFTTQPYQHVSIFRDLRADSQPYYVDKIFFHENAGLFFLLEAEDKARTQVLAAMRLLADSGIGTDRNNGNGQFEVAETKMTLETSSTGNYQLNLSLYWPEQGEIEPYVQDSYYGLIKRGGYISSPENPEHLTIRKRSVYMFTEGSVFPFLEGRKGRVDDLAPDNSKLPGTKLGHKIWRDGQPLFLPFNFQPS